MIEAVRALSELNTDNVASTLNQWLIERWDQRPRQLNADAYTWVAWDAPVIISLLEAARRFPKDGTLLKTIKAIAFDGQFASSILGINSRISEVAWITYLEAELAQVGPGHEKDRVNRLLEWRRETLKRTDDPAVWRLAKLRAIERLLKKCDPTLLRGVLLLKHSEAQQGANQSARAQDEEILYLSRIVREISVPTGQDK